MADAWPVTLDEAKSYLNKSGGVDDSEVVGFIDAATRHIENQIGPVSPTSVTEQVWPRGGRIILSTPRATAITSISDIYGNALAIGTYPSGATLLPSGIVQLPAGAAGFAWDAAFYQQPMTVTYTAGFANVPNDLRLAALDLVDDLWSRQRGATAAGGPFAVAADVASLGGQQPRFWRMILDNYRLTAVT